MPLFIFLFILYLFQANQELGNRFPVFNEISASSNALERVLALEIELAEALQAKKKSSIQFQRYTLLCINNKINKYFLLAFQKHSKFRVPSHHALNCDTVTSKIHHHLLT